jgi:hypothetical protein
MKPIHFNIKIGFEGGDDKVVPNVPYENLPDTINKYLVASQILENRVTRIFVEAISGEIIPIRKKKPKAVES